MKKDDKLTIYLYAPNDGVNNFDGILEAEGVGKGGELCVGTVWRRFEWVCDTEVGAGGGGRGGP